MDKELNIILGYEEITIGDSPVQVRELSVKQLKEFLRALSGKLLALVKVDSTGKVVTADITPDTIVTMIASSEDLAFDFLGKVTGRDAAWLDGLSPRLFSALLDKALEINLNDDLLKNVERLGQRLKSVLPAKAASPPSGRS